MVWTKGEGLLPFLGQIQADQHAGVGIPQKLLPGVRELLVQVIQIRLLLLVQIYIASSTLS